MIDYHFEERIQRLGERAQRELATGLRRIANEDNRRLVAYVTARSGMALETQQLRKSLASKLPAYMIPSAVLEVDSIPRLANGKIDRKRMAKMPTFEQSGGRLDSTPKPASADGQQQASTLADIWAKTLNTDYVLPDDDFFELGGHSLLGVQLLLNVKEVFGVDIPLADLFEASRLSDMVDRLTQRNSGPRVIAPIQAGGSQTAIFSLHGGDKTLAAAFGPGRPLYLVFDSISTSNADMGSVEKVAAHYLQGIREQQPTGPYFLCGYSIGGMIAYEAAVQLRKAGESVALVALFDPLPPSTDKMALGLSFFQLLAEVGQQKSIYQKCTFLTKTISGKGGRWLKRRMSKTPGTAVPKLHEDIRKANARGYSRIGFEYRYPVSDFPCTVYIPERHPIWVRRLSQKWREIAPGLLSVECVAGAIGHMDMTRAPCDARLAKNYATLVSERELIDVGADGRTTAS